MIKVLFFARIREQLDCASLEREWDDSLRSIDGLRAALVASGGEQWQAALTEENIICAVNQQVITGNIELADGDEVAFFPPVTGG
jgi:molybdopterin synthase sulfur carrier subunit